MVGVIVENDALRNRRRVFKDRVHAGRVLATMLQRYAGTDAQTMAVPAGGVPVAAELAKPLGLALDVAVVSKITLPWNTEAGYGAVAFDGTVRINRSLAKAVRLTDAQISQGTEETTARVMRRVQRLRGDKPWPDLINRTVIVVDDGLASGFTMLVTIEALRKKSAERIVVAVPTAPDDTLPKIAERVHELYCANIREERPYAVADAYEKWYDVSEEEASAILAD
jgi:predicted phosphoribosyltransferase